jgi:hypothetical protein
MFGDQLCARQSTHLCGTAYGRSVASTGRRAHGAEICVRAELLLDAAELVFARVPASLAQLVEQKPNRTPASADAAEEITPKSVARRGVRPKKRRCCTAHCVPTFSPCPSSH